MLCIHLSTFLNNLSNSVKCAVNIDLLSIFCRRTMINTSISFLVYFTSNAKLLKKNVLKTVEKSRIIEFALFCVTSTAQLFDQGDSLYREKRIIIAWQYAIKILKQQTGEWSSNYRKLKHSVNRWCKTGCPCYHITQFTLSLVEKKNTLIARFCGDLLI